jgi:hypothetical protein
VVITAAAVESVESCLTIELVAACSPGNEVLALATPDDVFSIVAMAWLSTVSADLFVNKPLGLAPPGIEFKRAHLYDVNPVGVGAMLLSGGITLVAHFGAFGETAAALAPYLALGIAFVSLGEGIDATTPAGKLQLHILAAIAEFERARIQERVLAGLARARAQGKRLGRPKARVPLDRLLAVAALPNTDAARALSVSLATIKRWRKAQKSLAAAA